MIILEPFGGLANRMRVIASGIWLTRKLKTKLIVLWNENHEINCPYNLLFQEVNTFLIEQKKEKYNEIKTSNQPSLAKKIVTDFKNKIKGVDYCLQESDFYNGWASKLDIYEIAKRHKVIYIQTCQEFGENLFAFKYFQPILPICEKIEIVTKKFTELTIGVHIRRMDNTHSIQNSPTDLFITRMKTELDSQKNTTFFLCTDDLAVEKAITAMFPEKVITYKKEFSRQTVQGMQDAVIDLYCLSKTRKILGSYWSTYSEISSRLNNIELEILKK